MSRKHISGTGISVFAHSSSTYHPFCSLKVYICGGFNGSDYLSTAECYDPESDQWTLIASMDSSRSGVGVIAYADRVFAVSALNTADTHTTQKHCKAQRHEKMSSAGDSDWINIHFSITNQVSPALDTSDMMDLPLKTFFTQVPRKLRHIDSL